MTQVRFGVGLFATENASDGVRLAQRANALGFDRFWVGDSHMIWREAFDAAKGRSAFAKLLADASGSITPGLGLFGRIRTEQDFDYFL